MHFIASHCVHHLCLFPVIFETVTVPVTVDSASGLRAGVAGSRTGPSVLILCCSPSPRNFCHAIIRTPLGSVGSMALRASEPVNFGGNSPNTSPLTSSSRVSAFSTSAMAHKSDGAGCGRGQRGRSPARSRAHSPIPKPPRCRRHGGAINAMCRRRRECLIIDQLQRIYDSGADTKAFSPNNICPFCIVNESLFRVRLD